MKKISSFFLQLAVVCVLVSPDAQAQVQKKLALVGGMLLDGYEEVPPLHHAVVLIEGNKIVKVGRVGEVQIPPDATVIDTSGSTILPGLIDLHVHLTILGHGDYNVWDKKYDPTMERVMEIASKQLLMAGVTTAVELGAAVKESASIRDRINKGQIPGPRMIVSGPWLIRTSRPIPQYQLYYQRIVDTPDDAAKATEEYCKAGMDVIKAYSGLTLEHYKAITSTAQKYGKKVHAHLGADPQPIWDALNTGCVALHHVGSGAAPPFDPALIQAIERKGVAVCLTMAVMGAYIDSLNFPERLDDPQLKKDFTPEIYKDIMDSLQNFPTLRYFSRKAQRLYWLEQGDSMKQWLNSGVLLAMGSDSGTPLNFHTEALLIEIKSHVQHGMSPKKAISAATRVNAEILGKGTEIGTIEAGKLADIIVVKGNPLFDINFLSQVQTIIKDGVVYK